MTKKAKEGKLLARKITAKGIREQTFTGAMREIEERDGKPYELSIEAQFRTWYDRVKKPDSNIAFEISMRNSYYSGAAEMGFIMTTLAAEGTPKAGEIVDSLFNEIKSYFESAVFEGTNLDTKLK